MALGAWGRTCLQLPMRKALPGLHSEAERKGRFWMSASHGDVPPGIWLAVLVGFVTLLAFSLLFVAASLLAGEVASGLGLLALTILVGWIEWRAWRRGPR